jgi:hypothetical protein
MIPEFWIWILTTGAALCAIRIYGVATLTFRLGEEAVEILALGCPSARFGMSTSSRRTWEDPSGARPG